MGFLTTVIKEFLGNQESSKYGKQLLDFLMNVKTDSIKINERLEDFRVKYVPTIFGIPETRFLGRISRRGRCIFTNKQQLKEKKHWKIERLTNLRLENALTVLNDYSSEIKA